MKIVFSAFVVLMISIEAASGQPAAPRPNIIMIIGDDMRYDSFEPTGGPSWFDSPSINRIAYEGASFENYYCVYSLCTPSRSTMMTGLYAHSNGSIDGDTPYFPWLPTIATILDSAGYHTGMIGKFGVYFVPQPGWDYWMGRTKFANGEYLDPKFNVNGIVKTIEGNVTQIITDTTYRLVSEIDTPFFVCIGHQAPHQPAIALPASEGIYASEEMPVPANFFPYNSFYPSFLYANVPPLTETVIVSDLEKYFECLKDIDRNIEDIFDVLSDRNLLDNTLLMFTSDNGFLFGEHALKGKELPYDPSIKLPMFIRYPAWFNANTLVKIPMGLTVDIAPTLLEAAGVNEEPYHFQGLSLHKLANGELTRDKMLYENIKYADTTGKFRPSIRSIRSNNYKYNLYFCEELTEEFFDLEADPAENFNLIKDLQHADLINQYRYELDSMRIALNGTLAADNVLKPCYLVINRQIESINYVEDPFPVLDILSNPFKETITARFSTSSKGPVEIFVYNQLGQLMFSDKIMTENIGNRSTLNFDASYLPAGIYCLTARQNGKLCNEFIVKE